MPGIVVSLDSAAADEFEQVRHALVRERIELAGVTNPRVLESMRNTPRHEFIPRQYWARAYFDMALPIGDSQTISSPFIVASMTEVIDPQPDSRVLEIGTGSGYQAAVLSPLVKDVYTIEIVEALGLQAERDLKRLGYDNVHVRVGDGFKGWPEAAPFDAIIVTCSPESVPQPLVDQLREGGRMVIPVGERYQQTLYLMTKEKGKLVQKALRPTLFVPMTGSAEQQRSVLPDGTRPLIINGDFEAATGDGDASAADFIPGWYYGRQFRLIDATDSAQPNATGKLVRFENTVPGRDSHLLQGLALDGSAVPRIRMSVKIRTTDVQVGVRPEQLPTFAISFYDDQRRDLGTYWTSIYRGTRPWKEDSRIIRVPPTTREAIVRIGLFGATGVAEFDEVAINAL
jgi:protein-L-isoaspartate(D-aspartate) O-methyltransferase